MILSQRPRLCLLAFFFLSCASTTNEPSTPQGQADAAPEAVPPATADASSEVTASRIEEDISIVAGGRLSVDHIGPQAHEQLLARLRAEPGAYLDRVRERFASSDAERLLSGYLPLLLEHLADGDINGAAQGAAFFRLRFIASVQATPGLSPSDPRVVRFQRGLELVAHGIDRPMDQGWQLAEATSVCASPTPRSRGVLRVAKDCTCGEPVGCTVQLNGATLSVDFRANMDAMGVCDDCYEGATACTLPPLPPSATLSVVVNGTPFSGGPFTTNASGHIESPACQ